MRYAVTTPVAGHTGSVGAVHFVDGRAELDDDTHAAEVAYCRGAGYHLEPLDDEPAEPVDEPDPAAPPKKSASTEAWRTWATEHGDMPADVANTKSRDELVAHFTEENDS
jgi:hypothetical protein